MSNIIPLDAPRSELAELIEAIRENTAAQRETNRLLRAQEATIDDHRAPGRVGTIQQVVSDYFDIPIEHMVGYRRGAHISRPRQIAIHFCREYTHHTYAGLGRYFGGRDQGTVMYACRYIKKLIKTDPELVRHLAMCGDAVREELGENT